ncbi:Methyl-accepting chemotaxis protein [Propionispora hippei DSM 15287]|uniref:Methyl-accepting chemotaxis protein n=2 Tax=Propionispora TaxID=112902 RepID=A0A1M6L2K8_9FIRM|nr:Methyl-accepting chemotaxis protein [Propionispora hippei DSM 15287]
MELDMTTLRTRFLLTFLPVQIITAVVLSAIGYYLSRQSLLANLPEEKALAAIGSLTPALVGASFVLLVLVAIYIMVMSGRLAEPIKLMRDECLLLSQGDLRQRPDLVTSEDEIGQLAQCINDMRTSLRALVAQVLSQDEQVAASSEELTASAHQSAEAANQVAGSITEIAQGTEKQAGSAEYIAMIADAIMQSTKEVVTAAGDVAHIAQNTSTEAEQGRQAVEQTVEQINRIGEGSDAVQQAIEELSNGSREIGEIVTLISSIAGQTNLLALNAAIEAARAGEHGRGFAVVAEEVRKLAEGSNQAAQQIGTLITKNQVNMEQAVTATQAGAEGIRAGIRMVNATGEAFGKIVDSIVVLSEQIDGIAQSIDHMAAGSEEMATGIQDVAKVSTATSSEAQNVSAATEEQSASMEEIASASQSLAQLAGELQAAVAKFRI